jgi:hypothetical protein
MSSAAPQQSLHMRRHQDPPVLWQAVLIGSLVLHVLVLFTVRRLQVEIKQPQLVPVPVEIIDLSAPSGTDPNAQATTLTAPTPSTVAQPQVKNPASAPAPDQSVLVAPSPVQPQPVQPQPSPEPTPTRPEPKPQPSIAPQPRPQTAPAKTVSPAPATQPLPKATPPGNDLPTVPVKGTNPPPGSTTEEGGTPPKSPPDQAPIESGQPLTPTKTSVSVGIEQYELTPNSKREAGGDVKLKVTPPPQLELSFLGGLPSGQQELTAKVQFVVDNQRSEVVRDTIKVLLDSPALLNSQISAENLDSLIKKCLEQVRFEVTNNSSATQKAPSSEWVATVVITVL